jgi:hypothetical protein
LSDAKLNATGRDFCQIGVDPTVASPAAISQLEAPLLISIYTKT